MAPRAHRSCAAVLFLVCSSSWLAICSAQESLTPVPLGGQQSAFVGILTPPAGAAPPNLTADLPCEGPNAAKLIINDVTPVPAEGGQPTITIRNVGGKVANLTGYTLAGTNTNKDDPAAKVLRIPVSRQCDDNTTILPGDDLVFTPKSDANPCGFEFTLDPSGSTQLSDAAGNRVAAVGWQNATPGSEVLLQPDGSYKTLPTATLNVVQVLTALGNYETLIQALKVTGVDAQLNAASDPNYTGPVLPSTDVAITPQFPWWFAGAAAPVAPPPPPPAQPDTPKPVGIPASGPYTLFAPTDDAFDSLLVNLGGGRKLPREALFKLPQLKDILLYHIVPGQYTADYLRNNTLLYTAKGVELVPILDGCQTGGKLMIHDSCIDKPTPDNYTCQDQVTFDKCNFPFMTSALAAQWQGGFCQRTCKRCSCAPDSGIVCAEVVEVNALANNGVVHGITRVLFPPPLFTKEAAIAQAAAANATGNATAANPLGAAPPVGTAVGGAVPPLTGPGALTALPPPVPVPAVAVPAATTPAAGAAPAGASGAGAAGASPGPALSSPQPAGASPQPPAASPPPAAGRRRLLW